MFDDVKKAYSSFKGKNLPKDLEVERIKALLFSDIEEKKEPEEDLAAQKVITELFDFKPKTNTLKDWMAKRKEKDFLK